MHNNKCNWLKKEEGSIERVPQNKMGPMHMHYILLEGIMLFIQKIVIVIYKLDKLITSIGN